MVGIVTKSGLQAELLAASKLKEAGFFILGRNRKICGVEIDILARKDIMGEEHYFFVECKFRSHPDSFPPLSFRQKERYRKAAAHWQAQLGRYLNIHMTLALIVGNDNTLQIIPDYF